MVAPAKETVTVVKALPEPTVQVSGMEAPQGVTCAACPVERNCTSGVQIKLIGPRASSQTLFLYLCHEHFVDLLERGLKRYQALRKENRIIALLRK